MTAITLPPRKPEWLRQQLSQLEQRQTAIRDYASGLQTKRASYLRNGTTPPAHLLTAIARSTDDLAETQKQITVLETGWATLHPKPEQP